MQQYSSLIVVDVVFLKNSHFSLQGSWRLHRLSSLRSEVLPTSSLSA